MVDTAVFGARGYLGRSLVAILDDHPEVDQVAPVSATHAGHAYAATVPSMGHLGHLDLVAPDDRAAQAADVVFLATDASTATRTLAALDPDPERLVVDLSRAHRPAALDGQAPWVYGLPEVASTVDEATTHVANPGCYPTAALIALGPALVGDLLAEGPLVVDGKSGVSGAGATPRDDLHFPEMNEALRAYGVDGHDHTAEIATASAHLEQAATQKPARAAGGDSRAVRFTPHLVPQNRGLLVTAYAPVDPYLDPAEVDQVYAKVYAASPFVELDGEPDTAHVKGTNRARVAVTVDEDADLLVARCAIDNLVKGGAGTAVQNMNRALGLPEATGLPLAGVAP